MMPFSDEELINPVKASLEKSLPMLERDGGGLEFLGIKNGVVAEFLRFFHILRSLNILLKNYLILRYLNF